MTSHCSSELGYIKLSELVELEPYNREAEVADLEPEMTGPELMKQEWNQN